MNSSIIHIWDIHIHIWDMEKHGIVEARNPLYRIAVKCTVYSITNTSALCIRIGNYK